MIVLELIAKIGIGGVVGILVGLAVVLWVEPTTTEGSVLLVIVCIIGAIIAGKFLSNIYASMKFRYQGNNNDLSDGNRSSE
jgi:hypothetical protein